MIAAADGACALHAGVPAAFTCPRCGAFGCADCERRARPDALPMCPECWARREQVVETSARKNDMMLPNAALTLAVVSLVPFIWPAWIGTLILGLLVMNRLPRGHPGRARAGLAMAIAPIGLLSSAVGFYFLVSSH